MTWGLSKELVILFDSKPKNLADGLTTSESLYGMSPSSIASASKAVLAFSSFSSYFMEAISDPSVIW